MWSEREMFLDQPVQRQSI